MNTIATNSLVNMIVNPVAAFALAIGMFTILPSIANAQYSGDGNCCGTYFDTATPLGTYFDTATPITGTYFDTATPISGTYFDTATPISQGTYFDTATPRQPTTAPSPSGYYFDTVTPAGSYFDTVTPTGSYFDSVTPTLYTTTYDVYDVYTETSAAPLYSSQTYSQPYYQQPYAQPFYQQPSNTTISERTDIFAPTNTCTAPNTCNSTYTDNSVFNAPTTITNPPAQTIINNAAPVSPVVVPQYTVQAYVPPTYNYPTYQQPYVQPYVSPVNPIVPSNPYVALTQIPYTGLDLGLFGNAAYWLGLAAFAVGAGYLAVYYLPSIMNRRNESFVAMSDQDEGEAEPEKKTEEKEEAASITSPITVAMPAFAVSCGGTRDSMFSIPSTDGRAPRLVISRA